MILRYGSEGNTNEASLHEVRPVDESILVKLNLDIWDLRARG
jgi:hypothetical protein